MKGVLANQPALLPRLLGTCGRMGGIILVFLLLLAMGRAYGEPVDFIVLLDVSESMFPFFDDTVHFLIRRVLEEHLQIDDGFHLLSFASTPETEIGGTIRSQQDVDKALNRILLLHPLGKYTDLVSAFKFLHSYTKDLRPESRKKLVILTDGIHDPPQGSPYEVANGSVEKIVEETARQIREEGWDVGLMEFPGGGASEDPDSPPPDTPGEEPDIEGDTPPEDPGDGESPVAVESQSLNDATATESQSRPDETDTRPQDQENNGDRADDEPYLFDDLSETLSVDIIEYTEKDADLPHLVTGAPELIFPGDLGRVRRSFALPLKIRNLAKDRFTVHLTEILWNGENILDSPSSARLRSSGTKTLKALVTLPEGTNPGPITLELEAIFSDDVRIFPRTGTTNIILRGSRSGARSGASSGANGSEVSDSRPDVGGLERVFNKRVLVVLGYVGGGIVAAALLILLAFGMRSLIRKVVSAAGSAQALHQQKLSAHGQAIEMRVYGQNTHIGMRNVHFMRDGTSRTVGGGISSFLIYIYQFPMRVAEVWKRGETYVFRPIKLQYCRDTQPIENCLDKDILLISEKGREVVVRFCIYVSALDKINYIMRLTEKPGVPVR